MKRLFQCYVCWGSRARALPLPSPVAVCTEAPEHSRMPSGALLGCTARWGSRYSVVPTRLSEPLPFSPEAYGSSWVLVLLVPLQPTVLHWASPAGSVSLRPKESKATVPSVVPCVSLRKFTACHHELLNNNNNKNHRREVSTIMMSFTEPQSTFKSLSSFKKKTDFPRYSLKSFYLFDVTKTWALPLVSRHDSLTSDRVLLL